MPPQHEEEESKEEDKPEEDSKMGRPKMESNGEEHPKEYECEAEEEEKTYKEEDSPKKHTPTKSPIKDTVFIQNYDEEGEDTRMEQESPSDKEIEVRKNEEEGDR